MDSSLLELQRQLQEDIEGYEQKIVELGPQRDEGSIKENIVREHSIFYLLSQIQAASKRLLETYRDADGELQKELESTSGQTNFYSKLNELEKVHQSLPFREDTTSEKYTIPDIDELVRFSGEERGGQYCDLHNCFALFRNIPKMNEWDYIEWLERFPDFETIERKLKYSKEYKTYLLALNSYLEDFFGRVHPLVSMSELHTDFLSSFNKNWDGDIFEGWKKDDIEADYQAQSGSTTSTTNSTCSSKEHNDMDTTDSSSSLQQQQDFFCSTCSRSFAKKSVFDAHMKSAKHLKRLKAAQSSSSSSPSGGGETEKHKQESNGSNPTVFMSECREIARLEWFVFCLTEHLRTQISNTKVFVERKQLRSSNEILADIELEREREATRAAGDSFFLEEEDDDPTVSNPLKLPLGWDGKPIPLWLYKLHGLSLEFKCEICGNATYMGPRAFSKHFTDSRHLHGLKVLGIPHSSHFNGVTKIVDAQALWLKIQTRKHETDFSITDEEVEMPDGSVVTRGEQAEKTGAYW